MSSSMPFPEINGKDKEFYVYKWDFEFYDKDNKKTKIYPERVNSISKVSLYKEKVMPVLLSELRFRKADVAKLKSIQKRCECTISCTCIIYSPTTGGNNSDVKSGTSSYVQTDSVLEFTSNFEPVFDVNTFKSAKYDEDEVINNEEENLANAHSTDSALLDSPTQIVNVSFFQISAQCIMKTLYNAVLSDDSGLEIGTALNWVCSQIEQKHIEGYVIDKPANNITTNEVIIPPLLLIPTINYLQTMYGVYENGIQPFIDYDKILYILDKYADSHDHVKKDTTLVHVYVVDANKYEAASMTRSLNDSKEPLYLGVPYITNTDDEVLKGELVGNNFAFSSFNQSIDAVSYNNENEPESSTAKDVTMVLKRNIPTHDSTGEKTVCDYDEMNNVYNMSSRFNEVEARSQSISVTLQNARIEDFKVNKFVELHFQNSSKQLAVGGVYYLNSARFDFTALPSGELNKLSIDINDTRNLTKTSGACVLGLSRRNPVRK